MSKAKSKILGKRVDGEEKAAPDGEIDKLDKPSWKKNLKEKRKNQAEDNHKENLLFVELVKRKKKRPLS